MNSRELFLRHVAQTSPASLAFEIERAECATLYDTSGNTFLDLIGGISVANIGHGHPKVLNAIRTQLDKYLHVMVYGEFVETPQVQYAQRLTSLLPANLNSVYFTNSGAEAVEGAMKLAKRITNRSRIVCFNGSYHGSTQGALSAIGDEYWRQAFRPLLPDVWHLNYNDPAAIDAIDADTACVLMETVQAESGIAVPDGDWLRRVQAKCKETGALLILDEIQAGFGRTGKLWAFEWFGVVLDILLLGKALGGGLPLGAFIADKSLMDALTDAPVLGHITTFGGHPLSCAAGLAALDALLDEGWIDQVKQKETLFRAHLNHPAIKAIRSFGLWMAVEFADAETCKRVIDRCLQVNEKDVMGLMTDWFLFAPHCLRIAPPLIISEGQIERASLRIKDAIDQVSKP
ncbi:MAG: aspartate aminotransferase family protein [Bacteroidota bacterium]